MEAAMPGPAAVRTALTPIRMAQTPREKCSDSFCKSLSVPVRRDSEHADGTCGPLARPAQVFSEMFLELRSSPTVLDQNQEPSHEPRIPFHDCPFSVARHCGLPEQRQDCRDAP